MSEKTGPPICKHNDPSPLNPRGLPLSYGIRFLPVALQREKMCRKVLLYRRVTQAVYIIPSVWHHTALYPTASCTKLGNAPYRIGFPINRAEITQYDYN